MQFLTLTGFYILDYRASILRYRLYHIKDSSLLILLTWPTLLKWLRPNDYLVIPNGELELVNLWELVSWWGQVLKVFYKVTRLFYLKTKTKKPLDSGRAGSYAITTPLFIVNILTLKKKKRTRQSGWIISNVCFTFLLRLHVYINQMLYKPNFNICNHVILEKRGDKLLIIGKNDGGDNDWRASG